MTTNEKDKKPEILSTSSFEEETVEPTETTAPLDESAQTVDTKQEEEEADLEAGEFGKIKLVKTKEGYHQAVGAFNYTSSTPSQSDSVLPPAKRLSVSSSRGPTEDAQPNEEAYVIEQSPEIEDGCEPPSTLARGINVARMYNVQPGAFPLGGTRASIEEDGPSASIEDGPSAPIEEGPGASIEDGASSGHEASTTSSMSIEVHSNNCLAVANLVLEDCDLQTARPHIEGTIANAGTSNERQNHVSKRCKTTLLLGAILIIVIVFIFIAVLISAQKEYMADFAPAEMASSTPTQAPTSASDYMFKLLPPETTFKISEEPESPQAMAFDWLMEDYSNLPNLPYERIMQRFVLATLYHATGGYSWNDDTNWLDHSIHECTWFNKPSFARKDVLSQLFTGYLSDFYPPTELQPTACNHEGLYEHLWLDQNNLGGTLPEELYLLTSLKTMSFSSNQMQGTISSLIGQLSSLEGAAISYLQNAGSIPSEIGLLADLRVLALNDNNHKGSIPSELWQLSNLSTLILSRNPELQGTIPSIIGSVANLRWLLLDEADLSGSIPKEIGLTTSLEWMVLYMNHLSGRLPSEVSKLSNLRLLSLYQNMLEGPLPTLLGGIRSLSLVALRDNLFSGPVPSELGLLTNLAVTLNLRNNELSGAIPSELGLLSGLMELELMSNKLTGQIPSEFGQLQSMGQLTFSNNSLSGTVPQELSDLQNTLHTLKLEGNQKLSGSIPAGVCNMNGTCIGTFVDPCEGPHGLSFDRSGSLCGCGCPCGVDEVAPMGTDPSN
ncbi:LRR receptor-like serine threonine-protein kinase At4g08850-like [Seminavis robusta]|uniref:LRR receptor-like serine threonine-protein kinase At4g08850-like n=1 Tax=Seminavis robusta TaxID=568900 RepID=A0A9N8H9D6_9STRA|nr:LRR receptor-like serine threonine-protein kinase At4g08850-like [Seminavis robusta]|eukprot:Sro202_g085320.1 LRR receptor-like serine threonine-protein kinase At4g08850-like (779) ;mRNA; f:17073-19483